MRSSCDLSLGRLEEQARVAGGCACAKKPLERIQNLLYCCRDVRGAYSSLMSLPAAGRDPLNGHT